MNDHEFEAILQQALQPPVQLEDAVVYARRSRKGKNRNIRKMLKKGCIVAAALTLLTTTVYAAGAMNISKLVNGTTLRRYDSVIQAEEKAGFEMDDLDEFSNGYRFARVHVDQTRGLDEKNNVRLTYNEISVELVNTDGEKLQLIAHADQDGIVASKVTADQTRMIGEIALEYRLHHYKFVPEDYVLSEADKVIMQQPGYFLSYGSETGTEEKDVAFLNWEKEGICYLLMDSDGSESADNLFSMAEELILCGK